MSDNKIIVALDYDNIDDGTKIISNNRGFHCFC